MKKIFSLSLSKDEIIKNAHILSEESYLYKNYYSDDLDYHYLNFLNLNLEKVQTDSQVISTIPIFSKINVDCHYDVFILYYKIVEFINEISLYYCPLTRIGPNCDGGYLIPEFYLDILKKINKPTLLSFGVGNNVQFEEDIKNKIPNLNIQLFDHTIEYIPFLKNKFDCTLHKQGLYYYPLLEKKPLNFFTKDYKNLFLKIDIEGDETLALLNTNDNILNNIDCLILELHDLHKKTHSTINQKISLFKKLKRFFYLVHLHGTTSADYMILTNNNEIIKFPNTCEYTFIKKELYNQYNFEQQKIEIPNKLDFSNSVDYHAVFNFKWEINGKNVLNF